MTDEKRQRQPDEIFCPTCGEPIKKEAVICVHCGVQVQETVPVFSRRRKAVPAQRHSGEPKPKSKTTAVLLAIFLGPWTWVYTYQRDCWKFWIAYTPLFTIIFSHLVSAIQHQHMGIIFSWINPNNFTLQIISFGFWLWALILACARKHPFYDNYPNG